MTAAPCPRMALAQQQAADWYALLSSGEVSDAEHHAWHAWRGAAPEHAQAWALVEDGQHGLDDGLQAFRAKILRAAEGGAILLGGGVGH